MSNGTDLENMDRSYRLSSVDDAVLTGTLQQAAANFHAVRTSIRTSLRDYRVWVGKSPSQILQAVKELGGWTKAFPDGPPTWLHRIRNYFNVEPTSLTRLDRSESARLMVEVRRFGQLETSWRPGNIIDSAKKAFTLSGDVYKDEQGNFWYQMGPGGAIFHYGWEVFIKR